MKRKIRLIGKRALPAWLLVAILIVSGAGAAAGTVLAGQVTGEVPVAVSQALLVEAPTDACSLITLTADNNGDASWSTEYAMTGEYSAKLVGGAQTGSDYAAVVIPMDGRVKLSEVTSFVYSYYFANVPAGGADGFGAHVCFYTHDPNDGETADITLYSGHSTPAGVDIHGDPYGGTPSAAGWNTVTVLPATTGFGFFGSESESGFTTGFAPNVYRLEDFQGATGFEDHVIDRIQIEYGWWGAGDASEPAYVDEAILNNFEFLMHMCDLVGVDNGVPQGTQKIFHTPNRYFGAAADDNTGFQFAAEVAVGDLYVIALPLKNASENDLVAMLDLIVPACLEVEVVSADQIHSEGNVTEAVRIGLNRWKITVLADAEYESLVDYLYIAVQADDNCAPGYYTISGTLKQIAY